MQRIGFEAEIACSEEWRTLGFGTLCSLTHKICDSEVGERVDLEATSWRAGCRLTAYEFSGNTRANARVLSAATRG